MLRNSKLTQKALRMTHGITFCAFGSAVAFGLAGCQSHLPNDPIVKNVTQKICIKSPDASACNILKETFQNKIKRCKAELAHRECLDACVARPGRSWCDNCETNPNEYRCRQRRCLENPDLPECENVVIPELEIHNPYTENDMLAHYRDVIKEMQEAGELPWLDVNDLEISYSYTRDEKKNTVEFLVEFVTTSPSVWYTVQGNWEDSETVADKLFGEHLKFFGPMEASAVHIHEHCLHLGQAGQFP